MRRRVLSPGRMLALAAAVILLGLLETVTVAGPVLFSTANWTVTGSNAPNTFTTANWSTAFLYSWGYGLNGRTGAVLTTSQTTTSVRAPGFDAWASVASGYNSSCGITTGGALYCMGYNGSGQLGTGDTTDYHEPVRVGAATWSQVAEGYADTCAIKSSDSTLWCWGYNVNGQVGNNTTGTPVTSPAQVSTTGTSTWSSVALGQYYACGLKTDQTLWCWGYNGNGRLGNGNTTDQYIPTKIGTATWTSVSAGWHSACAIKSSDSSLWCWGQAASGQLGNGTTSPDVSSPAQIGSSAWSALSAGEDRTCGLRVGGTIWCWGSGSHGGLGNGGTTDSSSPVQDSTGSTSWVSLTSMSYGSCATRTDGQLWCWGQNTDGQLGNGTTTDSSTPVVSGNATDWTFLSGGDQHLCGVRSADSGLWCQGDATYGKIGQDYYTPKAGSPTPLSSPNAAWSTGSSGYEGGCGVRTDGTLWCWGDNTYGETGLGDTADHLYPQQVGSATNWASVSVGTYATCGLRTTNAMYCWGQGANNQFGTGSTTDQYTPVAGPSGSWSRVSVGETHTCAISTAGGLSCWGGNSDGQVGNGGTTTATTPVALTVTGVSTWSYVSAGYNETCAMAATGSNAGGLYCWGQNDQGQVGNNATTDRLTPVRIGGTSWTSVEVGRQAVCGVQSAGTLWCWGYNNYGQLGQGGSAGSPANSKVPVQIGSITTWSDVAVGWGVGCAVRTTTSVWCWGRDDGGELGDRGSTTATTPQKIIGLGASWIEAHAASRSLLATP